MNERAGVVDTAVRKSEKEVNWKPQWVATLREEATREQQQKGQRFVVIRGKEGISLSNTGRRANIVEKMI